MDECIVRTSDGTRVWLGDTSPSDGTRGNLPVVFLHGFSGSSSATRHLARAVAGAGRRFIAPDLRGHGLSEKPAGDGSYSLDRFSGDVADVLDHLALGRVHLMGHCMGGMVAAAFALAHPDRVASLALVGTSLNPASERSAVNRASAAAQRPIGPLARRLFPASGSAEPHVDYSRFRNMGDVYWRRLHADWRALTWDVGDAVLHTIRALDLLDVARGVSAPVLVAHGARDRIFPPAAARRTHAAIVGSRLVMLPNDNHVTLVLCAESALFDELLAFADAAEASA